ncbi:MAG: vWA domain-containing protein [Candidatus Thorarchaeota archaeon]
MWRTSTKSPEDHGLIEVAQRSWRQALIDFYHPPLPEPEIENVIEAASFFYIDSENWTVHLNVAGVPLHMDANEAEPYLRSVCHHEIQHYLLCPYDGVTNGLMFAAARKKVNDATAMFVCNLFADLVVDSKLLKRYPSLTHNRINESIHDSAMRVKEHSPLWTLIVASYRAMWGFPIPALAKIDESTSEVATTIADIARKSIDNEKRWPKACEKIAEIIAKWMPEDENEQLPGVDKAKGGKETEGVDDGGVKTIMVPLDVDTIMGSPIEVRNGDMARRCMQKDAPSDLEAEMEDLAVEVEQRGGNLEDLEGVYLTAGYGNPRESWIQFWYRAKAKGLLRFDVEEKKFSGLAPLTPQVWRMGNPMEELDIVQSLQAFPVLIPNMSTRKWMKVMSEGLEQSKSLPDMLLVIDSSGSMTWGMSSKTVRGSYHTALVAAFAAMDVALRRGSRVAAINFSSGSRSSKWSTPKAEAERILLAYQGGGTVVPIKKIAKACDSAESNVMVLMMTDAEIANWDKFVESIRSLTKKGHKLFLFHIGSSGKRKTMTHRSLEEAGANVYPIKSVKDLPGLVIREVRQVYVE